MINKKQLVLDVIQDLISMKDSSASETHKEKIRKHKIFWFSDIIDTLKERNIKAFKVMPIINSLKKEGIIKKYDGELFPYFDDRYQSLK